VAALAGRRTAVAALAAQCVTLTSQGVLAARKTRIYQTGRPYLGRSLAAARRVSPE
jgi:hypothetical protein